MVNNRLESIKNKYDTLVVVLVLFMSCGFVVLNDYISNSLTIILWVITIIMIILGKNMFFSQKAFFALATILVTLLISDIVNGENLRTTMCNWVAIFASFLYFSTRSFQRFKNSFINALRFLCIVSLIGYVLFFIFPQLRNIAIIGSRNFNCFFIYVHNANPNLSDYSRNFGMFWEPGAFQTFINLALLLEVTKKKPSIFNMLLFIITTITTFSTTGYIATSLILLLPFVNGVKKDNMAVRRIIILVVLVFITFIAFNFDMFFSETQYTVFGKIFGLLNGSELNSNSVTSSTIRYYSIVKPLEAFIHKPILGYGYEGLIRETYQYTYSMNTCTFVNWFAVHGLLYGVIMLYGVYLFSKLLSKNNTSLLLIIIIVFVMTCAENYIDNASIMILVFYGVGTNSFAYKHNAELMRYMKNEIIRN